MPIDEPNGNAQAFERFVLDAVRELTAGGTSGISPAEAALLIATNEHCDFDTVAIKFPLAVDRLRQGGLLMSNPSGELRLTSAGQRFSS